MNYPTTEQQEKHEQTAVQVRETSKRYREALEAKTERYVQQLQELEQRCQRPEAGREHLLDEITLLNDSILAACGEFERHADVDAEGLAEARRKFREQTEIVLGKSRFISHARTWPFGHPGDHQILEHAYRNTPMSEGIGWYLDRYCLNTTLSVAVRERKAMLTDLLRQELARKQGARVLDIACGSCRDVFELAPEINATGARFICVDFDDQALQFSANRLVHAGLSDEQVAMRQYNALRMVNHQRNLREFGEQDAIYSVGFFDYLQDDLLVKLFSSLRELLAPGGKLIASFKDCRMYSSQFYHWMVDWTGFAQRTVEESRDLFRRAGIAPEAITEVRDRSGVILFFLVSK